MQICACQPLFGILFPHEASTALYTINRAVKQNGKRLGIRCRVVSVYRILPGNPGIQVKGAAEATDAGESGLLGNICYRSVDQLGMFECRALAEK